MSAPRLGVKAFSKAFDLQASSTKSAHLSDQVRLPSRTARSSFNHGLRTNTRPLTTSSPPPNGHNDARGADSATKSGRGGSRSFATFGLFSAAILTGYAVGLAYPPSILRVINPPPAPPSPERNSPEGKEAIRKVEEMLQGLDLVKRLRSEMVGDGEVVKKEDGTNAPLVGAGGSGLQTEETKVLREEDGKERKKWIETRPYTKYPEEKRIHSLTAGALRGPGRFAIPPLVFSTADDRESVIFLHLGRSMCGHDGIIHGGLVATILDEGLARPAILSLPSQIGVTATLTINYRSPTFADQFVVLRSRCVKQEGRKCWSEGTLETLDGKRLAEASALYVEPKFAKLLSNSAIKEVLDTR